jgi:hypothetical protein
LVQYNCIPFAKLTSHLSHKQLIAAHTNLMNSIIRIDPPQISMERRFNYLPTAQFVLPNLRDMSRSFAAEDAKEFPSPSNLSHQSSAQ